MPVTAYLSRRVVLPEGVRPAAVIVDHDTGRTTGITEPDAIPAGAQVRDFGSYALLPGFVDTHVHINDPGRTDWETFRTATRAAAAGGITTVVDMPLNCLPETTTVAALEQKRAAAQGEAYVDWRPWGGAVNDNQAHLVPLAQAGVPGFKCFLIYPGCDGLGLIDEAALRTAMPLIASTGPPAPGPCRACRASCQSCRRARNCRLAQLQNLPGQPSGRGRSRSCRADDSSLPRVPHPRPHRSRLLRRVPAAAPCCARGGPSPYCRNLPALSILRRRRYCRRRD